MTLQGTTVLQLCAEDLLPMLCVHASRHGWETLEGIASLAELLRARRRSTGIACGARRARCTSAHAGVRPAAGMRPVRSTAAGVRDDGCASVARADRDGLPRRLGAARPMMRIAHAHTRASHRACSFDSKNSYTDRVRYCARTAWHIGVRR